MAATVLSHSAGSVLSRRAVVARAEAAVRARPADAIRIATLCRIVGVSERGLRNAFYCVHGVSPKRALVTMRLSDVRRALVAPGTMPKTVTEVATRFGFYELGRFAAAYRHEFGEQPSQSLHSQMPSSRFNLSSKESR